MPDKQSSTSVLGLLHPLGHAEAVRVIGGACRQSLGLCPQQFSWAVGPADLVILAPTSEELDAGGWLQGAVQEATSSLGEDGLLYALADRRHRRQLQALLRASGFSVVGVLFHHPNWSEAGTVIPLEPGPISYAFSRLIRTDPRRRRVALTLMRVPGVLPLVRQVLPSVGLVAQRTGAQPQTTWFTRLLEGGGKAAGVVLNTSWRGREGAVLLHAVDMRQGEPVAIAKTWLSTEGEAAAAREAGGLQEIAARAAESGVRVPRLLEHGRLGQQPYLVETAVPGEKASVLLQHRPEQLQEVLTRLARWLLAWNSGTVRRRVLTQDLLEERLIRPARRLAPFLNVGERYELQLASLARRLVGRDGAFVAAHGDLTMVNVLIDQTLMDQGLIDQDMRMGVIDWETAEEQALPLADFFYAAVDAVAALNNYRDRPAAFRACFGPDGQYRPMIADLQAGFVDQLALTQDQVALSFYASWLSYALAERRETTKAAPDEFLRIAREAACGGAELETE